MPSRELDLPTSRLPSGRRALRSVTVLLAALGILVAVWGVGLLVLWGHAWAQLGADELSAVRDGPTVLGPAGASAPDDATTLVVVMTEARDPAAARQPELIGPVVLLQVGADRQEPAVLSLPGELPVSVDEERALPLAEAQRRGGLDLVVRAVADYSEVRIDHAVSLSVDALPELVDAAAPVEVCRATGCSRPTGDELRRALRAADDEELVELVGAVARGLGERVDGGFAVTSPFATWRIVSTVSDEVVTDVGLRGLALLEVADGLEARAALDMETVPLVVGPETDTVVALAEPAALRFQHLKDGTPLRSVGDDAGPQDLGADIVRATEVAVLNGAGVDGLASRAEAELETAGFSVVGTGNAESFDRVDTVITYAIDDPAIELAAAQLSETLGGATLQPLPQRPDFDGDEVDLLVTLGEDRAS